MKLARPSQRGLPSSQRNMPNSAPRIVGATALVLFAFLPACASESNWIERGKTHFSKGEFYQAFYCLHAARAEGYDSADIEEVYWPFRIAYLLKRAQKRVFASEFAPGPRGPSKGPGRSSPTTRSRRSGRARRSSSWPRRRTRVASVHSIEMS